MSYRLLSNEKGLCAPEFSSIEAAEKWKHKVHADRVLLDLSSPEWQRIQDRLKRCDELEAEISDVRSLNETLKNAVRSMADELNQLKGRLPKNADGDVVLWGDTVWFDDEGKAIWGVVDTFEDIRDADIKGEFNLLGWMPDEEIPFQSPNIYCYSTSESCRKSIEGSETK